MSNRIDKLLLRIAKEQAVADANSSAKGLDVKPRLVRERSLSEENAIYHPQGYFTFFCIHDKHKFGPCSSCKRTQADADRYRQKLMSKNS